jgi:hypothetical protein
MKIGVLGSGAVGQALARGYAAHGHEVRIGTRKQHVDEIPVGAASQVAGRAEIVVLAVLGAAAEELARSLAEPLEGKVLIDTTNPLDFATGAPQLFVAQRLTRRASPARRAGQPGGQGLQHRRQHLDGRPAAAGWSADHAHRR